MMIPPTGHNNQPIATSSTAPISYKKKKKKKKKNKLPFWLTRIVKEHEKNYTSYNSDGSGTIFLDNQLFIPICNVHTFSPNLWLLKTKAVVPVDEKGDELSGPIPPNKKIKYIDPVQYHGILPGFFKMCFQEKHEKKHSDS